MTGISDHFVFLQADQSAVASTELLTRPIGVMIADLPVMAAVDARGARHLLVPVPGGLKGPRERGAGVAIDQRTLTLHDRGHQFLDLTCLVPELNLVFERLLDDVVARLSASPDSAEITVRAALDEWRSLLLVASTPTDRSTALGLAGELALLERLAGREPNLVMQFWRGPSGAVHDFVNGDWEMEVKTTASVDGNFVEISNWDQLDPALVRRLTLVVVHMRQSDVAPSLDERIDRLVQMGVPRSELLSRVAEAGYVYESESNLGRFEVRSWRAWDVGPTFPGLRRSDVPERRRRGLAKIRYELSLDSAPRPLSDKAFGALLDEWVHVDG